MSQFPGTVRFGGLFSVKYVKTHVVLGFCDLNITFNDIDQRIGNAPNFSGSLMSLLFIWEIWACWPLLLSTMYAISHPYLLLRFSKCQIYIYIYIYVSVIKTCMQVAERPWTLKSLSVATLNWFGLRLWIEHHPMGHSSITHDNIIWIFLFVIYGSLTKWRQQTIYKFMKKPYCGTQSLSLIIISLAVFPLFHDYEMFAWLYFRLLDWYSPI